MSREYVLKEFRPAIDLSIDYAKELNPQQHAAVTALPGPALVIAGAGSGKTRTLTYRVAFLLEQGIPPERILLLTFTNKAAREMMGRVNDLLGQELRQLWGGTFHSIGARILRRHANRLGYRPDFTILDREDSLDLIKACITQAEVDHLKSRFPKPDVIQNILSMAANQRQPITEFVATEYSHFAGLTEAIGKIEKFYIDRKRAGNVMDFDDLQSLWLKLLEEHDEIRESLQRQFQFILVDEYQDTNRIQSDLIDLLAQRHGNVMVVGDDSQSIYSWRGANFRNIMEFPKRHPKAVVYKIETNYRSTPQILDVANAAIAANLNQFAKVLTPACPAGEKPAMVACADANQQAAFVAQRMLELREEGKELNHMAVLYRSHFHALELQLELTRRNIPFSITSGIRFFEQAHIKDVAAYIKLIHNPADEISFKRLVRMLPGIGGKGADKLWNRFNGEPDRDNTEPKSGEPLIGETEIQKEPAGPSVAERLSSASSAVPKKAAAAWAQFSATISQLEADDLKNDPAGMIELVVDAGYDEYLQKNFANWNNRLDDVEQLGVFARQYNEVTEFLTQFSLLTNLEAEAEGNAAQQDEERVRLSTIHQAKGLEFDVVFVIMLCDGLFPSARSLDSQDGEEEERRLFYVAVTRAKEELYLVYPLMRTMKGYGGDAMQIPSRFIGEIDQDLLEEWSLRPY